LALQTDVVARSDERFLKLLAPGHLEVLEASSQTVYGVWRDLALAYLNPAWFAFAVNNDGRHIASEWALGRSILDATPDETRNWYRAFFAAALWCDPLHPMQHEYDCSSGTLRRRFHMVAYPVGGSGGSPRDGLVVVHSLRLETPHVGEVAVEAYRDTTLGAIRRCMHCRRMRRARQPELWDWVPALIHDPPCKVVADLCPFCRDHNYSDAALERAMSASSSSALAR
jgi:hypothetical protein